MDTSTVTIGTWHGNDGTGTVRIGTRNGDGSDRFVDRGNDRHGEREDGKKMGNTMIGTWNEGRHAKIRA